MAACLPTYLRTYLPTYHTYVYRCILCKKSGTGPIQRGLSTCLKCRRDVQRARTHMQWHAHARSVLHTYIPYIYICIYSRIVQVSRFHLCARRELKTSPSCNVTETVTKYLHPPTPRSSLCPPLEGTDTDTAAERNLTKLAYATHKFYVANPLQKGKGKVNCSLQLRLSSDPHYKCISHIAYRSH